jgi:hypothetical protein
MTETTIQRTDDQPLDYFYLEDFPDVLAANVCGGAGAKVTANAGASGDFTFVAAYTKTYAEQIAGLGAIAFGFGASIALGDNPTSSVKVSGTGDRVIGYTSSDTGSQISLSQGLVLAIDRP